MSFTEISACYLTTKMISAYNHLRHFVIGGINEIEENVVNLDTDRNRSNFLIYFGIDPKEYIDDLNEKTSLIKKGDYDKDNLKKYLEDKINEINSLRWLIGRELRSKIP